MPKVCENRVMDLGGAEFTICTVHHIVIQSKKTMWDGICNKLLWRWQEFTHGFSRKSGWII